MREKNFKNYALKSIDAVRTKLKQAIFYIERNPTMVKSIGNRMTSPNPLSTLHRRFACARLSQSCLPKSCSDFSATFTTIAFDDSCSRWLEINT